MTIATYTRSDGPNKSRRSEEFTTKMHKLSDRNALGIWLGVSQRVGPSVYAASGLFLALLKYGMESLLFWYFTSTIFTPWDFANPLLTARESLLRPAPEWLAWALYLWTLPFLWIAVSMSIRRAADAGCSPWLGFIVLVPLVNLAFMFFMCMLPSQPGDYWTLFPRPPEERRSPLQAALAVAASLVVGGLMVGTSIYLLSSYGASLFIGTPILMGACAAYLYNRSAPRSFAVSAGIGAIAALFGCLAMLLFALEGIVCLVMAAPILVPLAALGGLLGKAIADASRRPRSDLAAAVLILPLWAAGESWLVKAPERVILTTVEIDAPPSMVWNNVVAFPDLPRYRAWYFNLGIACPERARIIGQGVGAIRHCEFSTGTFVEPITVWDEPHRLAFNVAEQPAPMRELSPYTDVHPPHLADFLRATRGEFLLVPLPCARTRLEGRTWYRSEMFPQWYWTAWSDLLIHRIHERVLDHIKRLSDEEVVVGIRPEGSDF